jgi:hypothetical protein
MKPPPLPPESKRPNLLEGLHRWILRDTFFSPDIAWRYRWPSRLVLNLSGRTGFLGRLLFAWASPLWELMTMSIAEQIRQVLDSKELSDAEKLASLHALIPADACKIEDLSQATPAQLKRLNNGIAISQAMQELRRG